MAKKITPQELKKQGEELSKTFADIRKKQHNFAMQIGSDGIVFHIDHKKPADVLWRNAKKDGGGPKGTQGRVTMTGKILELDCDDPASVPRNLVRLAKKHFSERGQPVRVVVKGVEEEDGDEETDTLNEEDVSAEREFENQDDQSNNAPARSASETPGTEATSREEPAQDADSTDTDNTDPQKIEQTDSAGNALHEKLQNDFEAFKPGIEAAETSNDKGVAKKIASLVKMFEMQINTDPKKARGILTLMGKILSNAMEAGDIAISGETSIDPNLVERRSRFVDLEQRLDDLLAELAA